MNSRNRERQPARHTRTRSTRPRILVVTEGEKTEPGYLEGFCSWLRDTLVKVEIPQLDIRGEEGTAPRTLVDAAKRIRDEADDEAKLRRDENLKFDSVWCVFDVDIHPNLVQAIDVARRAMIDVAVSNPCFELWLLLHFREPPGALERSDALGRVREHVSGYDKRIDFKHFVGGYYRAVERAQRIAIDIEKLGDPEFRNPSTNVHHLTEYIRTRVRSSAT